MSQLYHSRYRLHSPVALEVLNCFVLQFYSDGNDVENLIQIGDIYEMIWSHSQFLEIMLATPSEESHSKDSVKSVCAHVRVGGLCDMLWAFSSLGTLRSTTFLLHGFQNINQFNCNSTF